jgi:hypothetical protein
VNHGNQQIASHLVVSETTVKAHVTRIRQPGAAAGHDREQRHDPQRGRDQRGRHGDRPDPHEQSPRTAVGSRPGPFVALVAFVTVTTLGSGSLDCFAAVCAPGR